MSNFKKNLFALAFFFGLGAGVANAQDIIFLHTGEEIEAAVQKVGATEVEYKKFSNPTGPTYSVLKAEVFMIKYQNGEKDVFKTAAPQPAETQAANAARPAQNAAKVVPAGLVAYYTFDNGTADDMSGNDNHGSLVGKPAIIGNTPNGTGSAVNITKTQRIIIPWITTSYFSISFWIKDAGRGNVFCGSPNHSGCLPSMLIFNGRFCINGYGFNNDSWLDGATDIQDGEWHHIAFVNNYKFVGGSTALYIDGAPYGNGKTFDPYSPVESLYFGGKRSYSMQNTREECAANAFKIDNIRRYDRQLSAAEVKEIYNAER